MERYPWLSSPCTNKSQLSNPWLNLSMKSSTQSETLADKTQHSTSNKEVRTLSRESTFSLLGLYQVFYRFLEGFTRFVLGVYQVFGRFY